MNSLGAHSVLTEACVLHGPFILDARLKQMDCFKSHSFSQEASTCL